MRNILNQAEGVKRQRPLLKIPPCRVGDDARQIAASAKTTMKLTSYHELNEGRVVLEESDHYSIVRFFSRYKTNIS